MTVSVASFSAIPKDTITVDVSGSNYVCYTKSSDLNIYPPTGTNNPLIGVYSGSKTIPTSFFGMHIQQIANITQGVLDVPFNLARSHDSGGDGGCRWFTLNPSSGNFVWTNSDNWVNAMSAAGKTLMFTLGFTPNWAAASTPGTGKYDNGTTVTGSNQPPASMASWSAFCTAVATKYVGRIAYYEIWNEVNYPAYWNGTAAQLAKMTRLANQAIKAVDPAAKIVGPIVQEPETGGTGNAYLQSFLSASDNATGTGKDWIDICGVHLYPPKYNFQVHKNQYDNILASLTAVGKGALKIWNTETGVLQGTSIDDRVQAKWLKRSLVLCAALGVETYCWYAYDDPVMGMTLSDITAWNQIRTILLSGTMTGCNYAPDGTVGFTVNGINYII